MSHFTVLVVGPNIEGQMAPFQENNMGDCPREYLEFKEDEDADVDEVTGKRGYWNNPNSKWDWFTVGGRWTGFFKLKPGAAGDLGEPGLMTERAPKGFADSVLKGAIDLGTMRDEAEASAAKVYDFAVTIRGSLPLHVGWAEHRAQGDSKDHEAIRRAYWAQPLPAAWEAARKKAMKEGDEGYWPFGFMDEGPDRLLISREATLANARAEAITTHAVLKDGKWHERGEMGWFACVMNEKDPETWASQFAALIDSLPDDTLLTVVDCHI